MLRYLGKLALEAFRLKSKFSMVSIPGYYIKEQLYNGSRTLVYRAVRESDQRPVVIKLLKNLHPNFNELLQFRNQTPSPKIKTFPESFVPTL